jgi:hypothetical protein
VAWDGQVPAEMYVREVSSCLVPTLSDFLREEGDVKAADQAQSSFLGVMKASTFTADKHVRNVAPRGCVDHSLTY